MSDRRDVSIFQTEPLSEPLELPGEIIANLFASSSGTDADWVVKLIDVKPECYPDQPEFFRIDPRTRTHLFLAGHRVIVQIQSSCPLIDRKPHQFLDIPNAEAEDYIKATHRVYCVAKLPTHIEPSIRN